MKRIISLVVLVIILTVLIVGCDLLGHEVIHVTFHNESIMPVNVYFHYPAYRYVSPDLFTIPANSYCQVAISKAASDMTARIDIDGLFFEDYDIRTSFSNFKDGEEIYLKPNRSVIKITNNTEDIVKNISFQNAYINLSLYNEEGEIVTSNNLLPGHSAYCVFTKDDWGSNRDMKFETTTQEYTSINKIVIPECGELISVSLDYENFQ